MKVPFFNPEYANALSLVALLRGAQPLNRFVEAQGISRNNMQMNIFKACCDPIGAINAYFTEVHREAREHSFYEFNRGTCGTSRPNIKIKVGHWLDGEIKHLAARLNLRDPDFSHFKKMIKVKPYSAFRR
jgi:hypothetical protein